MPTCPLIGPTTGAVDPGDVAAGVALARSAGCRAVELSALHEAELPAVEAYVSGADLSGFAHVSVHAPLKGRALPEAGLVARLDALALPVVAHPATLTTPSCWVRLGDRLVVENDDGRKPSGQGPDDLDPLFDALPDARFCLDVSHALHAGGRPLVETLADRYRDRLSQLHVGCGCGQPRPGPLEADLVDATGDVLTRLGRRVPVVIERPTDATTLPAQLTQLGASHR